MSRKSRHLFNRLWGNGRGPRGAGFALLLAAGIAGTGGAFSSAMAQDAFYESAEKYLQEGKYSAALIEIKNSLSENPDNAEARLLLGKVYLRLGDPQAAESALLRARQLGLQSEELNLWLAYARLGRGSFDEVIAETANQLDQTSKVQRDLIVARGDALLALEKLDEAEDAYERVLAVEQHPQALRGMATIALMRQHPEVSRELLDQAIELAPGDADLVTADAEWYLRQGQFETARERYAKAIELNPMKLAPRIGRIRAALALGDIEAAQTQVAELKKSQPGSLLVLYQDSVVQLAAGNFEEAKRSADQVLAADRYHVMAMNVAGTSAYSIGRYEQAVARLTSYLNVVPDNKPARLILAASLLRLEDGEKAKKVLKPLMAEEPQDPRALSLMSTAEALIGDSDAALALMDKAVASSPEDATLRSQLGVLRIAIGDTRGGAAELQQALLLSPETETGQAGSALDPREITLIVSQLRSGDFDSALENVQRMKESHPSNARLLVLEGIAQSGRGQTAEAEAAFSRAVELNPQSVDARLNLAKLHSRQGDLDAAQALLDEILAQQPGHYVTLMERAAVAARSGDLRAQAEYLERAVAAQPTVPTARLRLALLYLNNQAAERALATAEPALVQNPKSIEFLGIAGQSQLQMGRIEEAIATFQRLVEVSPDTVEARFLLARAHGLAGQHQEMRAELDRALEIDPKHVPSQVALVRFLTLNGEEEEAKKRLAELKAGYPENSEVLAQEGWMRLREGQPAEAAKSLQSAFDRAGPAANRDLVDSLARAHWEARNWNASVEVREDWLENNPNDLQMLVSVGQAYTQLSRYDDATRVYRKILSLAPQNVLAMNNLAWLLQRTEPDEALAFAEKANELAPGTPSVMDTLGWLLLERGEAGRAVGLFEEAVQKAPANPQFRFHLAQALDQTDQQARAKEILEGLLADERLEAEHGKIRAMLEKIDQ